VAPGCTGVRAEMYWGEGSSGSGMYWGEGIVVAQGCTGVRV
jgi:hypothetical protein